MSGIYCIMHRETGRRYIGQSVDINRRWRRHKCGNSNPHLGNALKKYGCDAFDWIVLEEVVPENLTEREQYWIDQFDSSILFNEMLTVSPGPRHSEATIAKISESKKGRVLSDEHKAKVGDFFRGKTLTPEHRAKLSAAKTGQPVSLESREKIRAKLKGRKLSPDAVEKNAKGHIGKKHTAESIAKISSAKKGKKFSPEHRAALSAAWAANPNRKLNLVKARAAKALKRTAGDQSKSIPPCASGAS